MNQLAEILEAYRALPEAQRAQVAKDAMQATKDLKWIPNPGPQTQGYFTEADILLFGGEPGGGKDLALDTPLPTPFGWTTMGEVSVGDTLFDESGKGCKVVAKSEIYRNPAYRLTFSDGAQVIAGPGHQWMTSDARERDRALRQSAGWRSTRRANRPSRVSGRKSAKFTAAISARNSALAKTRVLQLHGVRTTQQIAESLLRSGGGLNHSVELCKPLQAEAAALPIDPYLLGAWLGDGNTDCAGMTIAEPEMVSVVGDALADGWWLSKRSSLYAYGVRGGMQVALRILGVLGNKHIPAVYLRASTEQRLALLQGLMDTDGYCDTRGQCEFTQVKRRLADDVQELLSSLGIKCAISVGVATLDGREIGPKYRIKFLTELPAFRLARKLLRQKRGGFRGTHNLRYIERVDLVGVVPTQCVQVDSPSRMFLCGRQMIPTHNSQLILGLAFNCHERALIMRRQYTDLDSLTEEAINIHGGRDGFNGSPPPSLKHVRGRIDFGAAARPGDEQHWMGRPHDFLGIDEATQFTAKQIRFLRGWLRTTTPGQRTRTVLATNPPLSAEGLWVHEMFAPWLNPQHPNPAAPGELRWFVVDANDKDVEVDGPGSYVLDGKSYEAESRTFIPSKMTDNPYLDHKDYQRRLDALPAEVREILMGGFRTSFRDQDMQVCPTAWVRAAQERWKPDGARGIPMCSMGVDASGGGSDPMVIAPRHDGWYAPLIKVEGKEIPADRPGKYCAGIVVSHRRDNATVIVDMGGGYGGPMYEQLIENLERRSVVGFKGAEASLRRTKERQLGFVNKRSQVLWQFREALDPSQVSGSPIALPPSPTLMADLTAATFQITPRGIKVESKEDVCERLGRSTDEGDAVVMAWYEGAKGLALPPVYSAEQGGKRRGGVQVDLGPRRSGR